jgi:hypothetical protein
LPDAAAALGCSVDTVRRRIKRGKVASRLAGSKYLIYVDQEQVAAAPNPITVVDDLHPSVSALLDYLRERDGQRDKEIAHLRDAGMALARESSSKDAEIERLRTENRRLRLILGWDGA